MSFSIPPTNRTAVSRAARNVSNNRQTRSDEELIQQWRDAHAHVLNTFQANIRNFIKKSDKQIIFVQRLKKLSTIIDKLQTRRASLPMNDIAGCRLIFERKEDIYEFRNRFHKNRAKHELISRITENESHIDKYDYIQNPKKTGYRGIHDVYRYVPYAQSAAPYRGLRIEVQYRTLLQHSWSTAVETSDAIDKTRVKFASPHENDDRCQLFRIASEIIARQEGCTGCMPEVSDLELKDELSKLESSLRIIYRLKTLAKEETEIRGKHVVLVFGENLRVKKFRNARLAMEYRNKIELENRDLDIVYVRLDDPSLLATAFRNYYRDAKAFIEMMPLE